MKGPVAIITDATSDKFWFPIWYSYYARQFGACSIYVVSYRGLSRLFHGYELGGLWELPIV